MVENRESISRGLGEPMISQFTRIFSRKSLRLLHAILLGASIVFGGQSIGRAADPPAPQAILQDLKSFGTMGSVLFIAAHPDDENTQLITYLSRGRNYRMAYLSVTRGDGGQNLIGSEFGEQLGLIRTNELLAARRID